MSTNSLFSGGNQFIGNAFDVNERAKIIGKNVARLRNAMVPKMSQTKLAKAIGVSSQNTIAAIESGKTQESRHLAKIAKVFNVKMADVNPWFEGEETLKIAVAQSPGDPDLEVYSSVEAGPDTFVRSKGPVQMTRRPASLQGLRDAYGVIIHGESMIPAARPGDTVLINPHLPARPGDLCLFFRDQDGEFRATLKEYRGQTAQAWLVKRYQPHARNYAIKKSELPKCHVVVTVNRR